MASTSCAMVESVTRAVSKTEMLHYVRARVLIMFRAPHPVSCAHARASSCTRLRNIDV